MLIWDTDSFYTKSLKTFGADLKDIDIPVSNEWSRRLYLDIAFIGYRRVVPNSHWTSVIESRIKDLIDVELHDPVFDDPEDYTLPLACFSAYIYGGLYGKLVAHDIGEDGLLLGQFHLYPFLLDNCKEISSEFEKGCGV